MTYERYLAAAQRVLDGDESARAARDLAGVAREDYPGDERFDELLAVLARYTPEEGSPDAVAEEVRTVIRETNSRVL